MEGLCPHVRCQVDHISLIPFGSPGRQCIQVVLRFLCIEMVNNSTNIKKMNNHLDDYMHIYLYSHHQMTQVQRRHRHNYIQYVQYIYNIRTQENNQPGHTLSFMIPINLHKLVRFNLFVDAIIPKKLIIFGLFVYMYLFLI